MRLGSPFARPYWWLHHRLKGLGPRLEALESHRTMTPEMAQLAMGLRLKRQLAFFGSTPGAFPEWTDLGKADPLEVFQKWSTLPIVRKSDLRHRFPLDVVLRWTKGRRRTNATGGSTGEPTTFVHDLPMLRSGTATMYYAWRRMGWSPGMPVLAIWGAQRDIGMNLGIKGRLKQNWLRQVAGIQVNDGFALDATRGRVFLKELLSQRRPCAIYGYTSLLEVVARLAEEEEFSIPPGLVATAWNGGETLFPEQSKRFEQVFGVPIQNDYGGREVGTMAVQANGSPSLEVLRPFIYLEVVDSQGKPCSPGEAGRILVTSTECQGTPFLRYEIGDIASYQTNDQDESGIRALTGIQGRISSTLTLNGKAVSGIYWNHLFKDFPAIRAFQVRAHAGALRILMEAPDLPDSSLDQIRTTLFNFIGPLPLQFERVDQIPITATGKLIHALEEEPHS